MEDQPEPVIMKSGKKVGLHYVAKYNEDLWRISALVGMLVETSVENTMFNSTMQQQFNVEQQAPPKKSNKNDQKRDQVKDNDNIEFRGV